MWLDTREARVNGQVREMDIEPQFLGDRTFIPIRFAAEFLGSYVGWIESERMVIIVFEQ
ncbi:MAG: copper amine oxidase N-terminal domain-containing protein [Defluviitaleaceae bacterium]|nr:copper amine oxidase N-terminal domain-containing protein [Defluviitaleaceae bacterium]